jgi:hypothetical protein
MVAVTSPNANGAVDTLIRVAPPLVAATFASFWVL